MVEDDAAECGEMPGAYCWGCGVLHCDACEIKVHSNEITVCNVCQAPFYSAPGEDDASQFKLLWSLVNDKPNGRHTPHAQYHLGDAFYFGRGVEQDRSAASKWLSLAFIVPRPFHFGDLDSQYALGQLFQTRNLKPEGKKERKLWKAWAKQANPVAERWSKMKEDNNRNS
eukprot:gene24117-32081_t